MVAAMGVTLIAGRVVLGYIGSVIIALILLWAGLQWLSRAAARRREDFTAQLPELARIIANGNAAGLSVSRSVAMAGRELSEPAGSEMTRVAAHLDLGWSLDAALRELGEQMPSRELDVLVRTIVIQARTGGALTDALMEISRTLEDRKELRREVRTVILGSAMSGYAVMGIGAGAVVLLNVFQPGMLDSLASTLAGRVVLVAALGFFAAGALLMRVVSRVEV
ncbi:type II secretion system F family protein [Actinomyces sp. 186855]|nr:type II secretion system F family protein [Actinomyces sp. AC-20-1]MCL3790295.1 type II secretion system F family protein [Actinomyces sp. 187325]MCL3793077.1 type II secretion system F family protein [Actinomyces sp. 186855]MCL3793799.1 type II secretion system F family protein [Actinomyces sp. 217892]